MPLLTSPQLLYLLIYSYLGIVREHCSECNNGLEEKIIEIQCRLFDVGSAIATPGINHSLIYLFTH